MRAKTPAILLIGLALVATGCEKTDLTADSNTTIDVSANPAVISLGTKTEGKSTITALVVNDRGVPREGVAVRFKTDFGRMDSDGVPIKTNSAGVARDTLTTSDDATVTVKSGDVSESVDVIVLMPGQNANPMASFTISPNPARSGDNVVFNGAASDDVDGTVTTWNWTFTSTNPDSNPTLPSGCMGTNPITCSFMVGTAFTLSFTNDQTVTVQLQVVDDQGALSSIVTKTLSVSSNLPPIADAGPVQTVTVNTMITLDGSMSTDPDTGGSIVRYDWNFGDGTPSDNNNATATVTHTYATTSGPAGFLVTLTVWDNGNGTVSCNPANTPPCTGSLSDQDTTFVVVNP